AHADAAGGRSRAAPPGAPPLHALLDPDRGQPADAGRDRYYYGRAEADLTPWIEYFVATLRRVFTFAREAALRAAGKGLPAEPEELRRLDQRARAVLALFARTEQITSTDVATSLGLS